MVCVSHSQVPALTFSSPSGIFPLSARPSRSPPNAPKPLVSPRPATARLSLGNPYSSPPAPLSARVPPVAYSRSSVLSPPIAVS